MPALLSAYNRTTAMRTMHKGLHRTFATSPHHMQATIKAVYHLSYTLPTAWCVIAGGLLI